MRIRLGAVTITIADPPNGSGPVWDCSIVDGTTTDCYNGSPVYGAIYLKVVQNGVVSWYDARPMGPLYLTSSDSGFWATCPDYSQGVAPGGPPYGQITAVGDYKVKVTVMDTHSFATEDDEHFWTVTSQ
jgi:hypothetical protein